MDRSTKLLIVNWSLFICAMICIWGFSFNLIGWIFILIQLVVCCYQLCPDKKIPWFESENRFSFKKWWVEGNKIAKEKKMKKGSTK